MKIAKRYAESVKLVDKTKEYEVKEALEVIEKMPKPPPLNPPAPSAPIAYPNSAVANILVKNMKQTRFIC